MNYSISFIVYCTSKEDYGFKLIFKDLSLNSISDTVENRRRRPLCTPPCFVLQSAGAQQAKCKYSTPGQSCCDSTAITGVSIFLFNFSRICCNESKFYSASYFPFKLANTAGGGDFRHCSTSLPTAVNENLKGWLSSFSLKNPKL